MAEEAAAPAQKKGSSTFWMLGAFMLVLFIMFDNNLRLATGRMVGLAFDPVASLWSFNVLWTLVFASVVMIVATTLIRHFLVDWVHQARVQEQMRVFQREFSAARKSNNTYQMKRLTEMQPEVMQLQAEMSSSQLKPMAFTMLLVIPIFAWLSTITAAPVVYATHLDATTAPFMLVAVGPDAQGGALLSSDADHLSLLFAADVHAFALPGTSPTGKVVLSHPNTGRETTIDATKARSLDWEPYRVDDLEAGSYFVKPKGDPKVRYTVGEDGHNTLSHFVLAMPKDGNAANARGVFVNGDGAVLDVPSPSVVYALIPLLAGTAPTGGIVDVVTPAGGDVPVATWDVPIEAGEGGTSRLLPLSPGSATAQLTPHSARLPWNPASDLNGTWWVMPHWILLYSLFSIPFGQLTQRALKLFEFSKVDLDQDGKAPGLSVE